MNDTSREGSPSNLHTIVLAGGRGTRLQHITSALGEPLEKQFCRLGGQRSLLQRSVDRLAPIAGSGTTTVVIRGDQRELATAQLADRPEVALLAQPADRGTGIAVLSALISDLRRSSDGITILSPSDHAFANESLMQDTVAKAVAVARRQDAPVLIGAEADGPRIDYGWIVPDTQRGDVRHVARFVEKPPRTTALALLKAGGLFNTMMMVARTSTLVGIFSQVCARTFAQLLPSAFVEGADRDEMLARVFAGLDAVDFSRDIIAAARKLKVVSLPTGAGWTDLGDEDRLIVWLEDHCDRRVVIDRARAARQWAVKRPRAVRPDRENSAAI